MSFEGVARAWVRFTRGFATAPAWLTLVVLTPQAAQAQESPPAELNPVPAQPRPGPRPALPPIEAPVAPVVPQPAGIGSERGSAPAPFPEGPPAPDHEVNALPEPLEPPHDQTQPIAPYYATNLPGTPQPAARPLSRPPGPGSHFHEGFFLRFTAGGGAAGMSYRERFTAGGKVSDVRTRGIAGSIDVSVGSAVAERFIVHGTASFTAVRSRRSIDDVRDDSYDSIGTKLWLVGAGVTYYFVPLNVYLTLVLGTGGMVEQRYYGVVGKADESLHTTAGFATHLSVGKEWWVGGRGEWGIGGAITGGFYAAPLDVGGVHSVATGNSITLGFSATLN